jgi:hypothetical protein
VSCAAPLKRIGQPQSQGFIGQMLSLDNNPMWSEAGLRLK